MPQLNDHTEALLRGEREVAGRAKRFWNKFKDFALQDNVIEVALGLIVAAAFTAVVNSFVSDILTPILSLLPIIDRQLEQKFSLLRPGESIVNGTIHHYNTLSQAIDDGAIVLSWGNFLRKVLNFFSVAISLYVFAVTFTYFSKDPLIKETVKCKECRKRINKKAHRCINCTSWQDGREERIQ